MNKYNKAKILLVLLVSICLFYANTFIVTIDSKIHNRKVLEQIDNVSIEKHNTVYYGIKGIGSINNLMQTVYVYGYAVVETEDNNTNRFVDLYFISDKNIYHILANMTWGGELTSGLKYLKIPIDTHVGFSAEFSTIDMKDGEYKLYIAVHENDKNYGIVYSGKDIIKKGKNITIETINISKEISNINSVKNENIKYGIDKYEAKKGVLNIQGWLYDASDNYTGKVYVHIKDENDIDKYYATTMEERPDVSQYFNNNRLINSGFQTHIKISNEETFEIIGYILEKDGIYYEKIVNVNQANNFYNKDTVIDSIVKNENIKYGIDKYETKKGVLNIQGWLYDASDNYTGKVYVHIKDENDIDKYYATTMEERPDVSQYFNNNRLINSGFQTHIKISNEETFEIIGYILEKDGIYYEKIVNVNQANNFYNKDTVIDSIVKNDNIKYGIDKYEAKKGVLHIQGWLYDASDNYTGKVYVHIKDENDIDKYYATTMEERPDVSQSFNNNRLINSGFQTHIKISNEETFEIIGYILEKDGIYYEKK